MHSVRGRLLTSRRAFFLVGGGYTFTLLQHFQNVIFDSHKSCSFGGTINKVKPAHQKKKKKDATYLAGVSRPESGQSMYRLKYINQTNIYL